MSIIEVFSITLRLKPTSFIILTFDHASVKNSEMSITKMSNGKLQVFAVSSNKQWTVYQCYSSFQSLATTVNLIEMPKYSIHRKIFLDMLERELLVQQDQGTITPCSRPTRLERQAGAIPKCQIKSYAPSPTNRKCPDCRRYSQRTSAVKSFKGKMAKQDIVTNMYDDTIKDLHDQNMKLKHENEQQATKIKYLLQQINHQEFLYTACQSTIASVVKCYGKEHANHQATKVQLHRSLESIEWFVSYIIQSLSSRLYTNELCSFFVHKTIVRRYQMKKSEIQRNSFGMDDSY